MDDGIVFCLTTRAALFGVGILWLGATLIVLVSALLAQRRAGRAQMDRSQAEGHSASGSESPPRHPA